MMILMSNCRKVTAIMVIVSIKLVSVFTINNIIADAFCMATKHQQPLFVSSATLKVSPFSTSSTRLQAVEKRDTNFLENIFSSFSSKAVLPPPSKPKYDNVIIEPDYRIAAIFLGFGLVLDTIPYIQLTIGPFVTLLGVLFLFQTFRIRFVFTDDNQFELKTISPSFGAGSSDDTGSQDVSALKDSGENVIVGGANCWDCNTIVNYDFFPRSMMDLPFLGQPVLIYFKETQTPESSWNEGPGKSANDPEKVASGTAVPGQVHFFPAICNAKQMELEFQKRNVQKL